MPRCWCEAPRLESWVRQPVNVWSNLLFFVVGVAVVLHTRRLRMHAASDADGEGGNQNAMLRDPVFGYLYAFGCGLTGLGSMFFHASLTHVGQWVDLIGMYCTATLLLLYNAKRLYDFSLRLTMVAYAALVCALATWLYFMPEVNDVLFGVLVLSIVVSTFVIKRKRKTKVTAGYLYAAVAVYYIGSTFWYLDTKGTLCFPQSFFQGHGIWHLCAALAAYYAYAFFCSEREHSGQTSLFFRQNGELNPQIKLS